MNIKSIKPDKSISLFVKEILVMEEADTRKETVLPFFADGFPGLVFQETKNGLFVSPHTKRMPLLFLYGQTITPIELIVQGAYQLTIFQLYPFVLRQFFNVTPEDINDDCYDLQQIEDGSKITPRLVEYRNSDKRIEIITAMLNSIFQTKKEKLDFQIKQAVHIILESKGQMAIGMICKTINSTERTFERRFRADVGISPKQFSNIIRFQHSLEQLTSKDFNKLTDVVYRNGYADQSHFIKVFKAFTGKTPKIYK